MKKLTLFLGMLFCSNILAEVELIDSQELKKRIENSKEELILLDVRTLEEYQSGHIKNSINIPHDQLILNINVLDQYRNQPIVVFCRSGRRAQLVIETLIENKFDQIVDLEGDIVAWKRSGFPVVQ
ncbi:MAG: rhodanese [Gammaproteobacteria bacterium]|nr:rhodanese [Gammaproteobacteria bacterium]